MRPTAKSTRSKLKTRAPSSRNTTNSETTCAKTLTCPRLMSNAISIGTASASPRRRPSVVDPVSRALGYYNFQCEDDDPMPDLHPGKTLVELPLTEEMRSDNPNAHPLVLEWYSAKHQVLTLYFCFELAHRRITAVRQRAAGGTVDGSLTATFAQTIDTIGINLNREAERLNYFLTLAASGLSRSSSGQAPGTATCRWCARSSTSIANPVHRSAPRKTAY
jgi:hypothetical protein